MSRWDIPGHQERVSEISRSIGTAFNGTDSVFRKERHTARIRDYEASRQRVRELFAELERLSSARNEPTL